MQTDERPNLNQAQDPGVQHDSETPLPKKPSVLFIASTLTIIVTFVIVIAMAYNGITH
ncbi:MAG: hypothetical protein NW220_01975 [Leptolyngbyaceae cyanobacterium bins.349]|nr:hypothetical protein [Leptolyngbyaceae cyanobacterium bins.349]